MRNTRFTKLYKRLKSLTRPQLNDLISMCLISSEEDDLGKPIESVSRGDFLRYMQRKRRFGELEKYFSENDQLEPIEIPFVILAMTSDEAEDLIKGNLIDKDKKDEYLNFIKSLKNDHDIDIVNLLSHYKDSRDQWIPHMYPESQTIQDIVKDILNQVHNQIRKNTRDGKRFPSSTLIRPVFYSSDFCATEHNDKMEELEKENCVLIVDSISLFHPRLKKILKNSHLSGNDYAAILVLSPIKAKHHQVNRLIEDVLKSDVPRIFKRFHHSWDKWCEFGMSDLRTFQRRVSTILF